MLLNAEQILAAGDRRTIEVDVPEWGEGAKVLVGSIGAMAHARLRDYLDGHGHPPEPVEGDPEEADEIVSCDSPAPPAKEPAAPALEKAYTNAEDMEITLLWCLECILDPATQRPAFGHDDLERLGAKNPAPLLRICNAALELSCATKESAATCEKNSGGTAGPGSGGV